MNQQGPDAPRPSVPVLTEEVVPMGLVVPPHVAPAPLDTEPPRAAFDEQAVTQQVLLALQRQLDLMLEYRLREVLAPLLARAADGLVRDARTELAGTLRDLVERAVAQELARHRGGR
jgi:hypothetical protein